MSSVADNVRVTDVDVVDDAPLSIEIDGLDGAVVSVVVVVVLSGVDESPPPPPHPVKRARDKIIKKMGRYLRNRKNLTGQDCFAAARNDRLQSKKEEDFLGVVNVTD